MGIPVRQMVSRNALRARSGFTLIEVLVAIGIIGVASTIYVKFYTSSLDLERSSRKNEVAVKIAEEYMNELRIHPELFIWPNFQDTPSNEDGQHQIALKNTGPDSIFLVSTSNAISPNKRVHDRDENLYTDFGWFAYARLNEEPDNYVEIMVQVNWVDGGKNRNLCLTSLVPRSIGEGVGQ